MTGPLSSEERLTKHNAVLLHVDHQEGLYTWSERHRNA